MKARHSIVKTPFFSYRIGNIAKGCQLCVQGLKTVVFVTGLCPRNCFYCPISDRKHQHDVTYANEWPTSNIDDIIKEAELCNSKGAGFTGGDPLVKINRTVAFIRALKQRFGRKFHIHLYTSFDLVTEERLKLLYAAGLDEIRFHADLQDSRLWNRIDIANKFNWDVGVEIPVIPGMKKNTERLLKFLDKKIKFLNLNELEVSDAEASKVAKLGFRTKDSLSYGVKGSESLALELLNFIKKNDFSYSVHYCTAKLKDAVQLTKRIQRRAKNIKRPFDILQKDGTLTRGAIYFPYLCPSIGYEKKLSSLTAKQRAIVLKKLSIFRFHLMRTYDIPKELLHIDEHKLRLLTNIKVVSELSGYIKSSGLKPAMVTEYPTWDELITELEWV
jgi:pyruvate formate-lyase activating enzyme-like uncharacterized protein